MINKRKLTIIVGIAVLSFISYSFISSTLNSQEIKRSEEQKREDVFEVKPAKVQLKVSDGSTFTARLENKDSVADLFEYLRNNDNFWYEKIAYNYGTEIDGVNRNFAPEGYKWIVFHNDEDITFDIGSTSLIHGETYEIKLVIQELSLIP